MESQLLQLSVSEFIALTNQTLEFAYPTVEIEGEVSGYKINQGKYVFFDLKDSEATVGCFMMVFQLRIPIEDGMKVVVTASPKLTQWGKFSLTVRAVRPSGEGALKKSFELLKKKLSEEGLLAVERKRPLPELPQHIAVISSTQAAGYADFVKILGERWGGLRVDVAHVQVQGAVAADQIIRALKYFNEQEKLPEVVVVIRGGGSADDLSVFNDELLVREIAASRVPVLAGIGHEVDQSLVDLAADVAASTPSNAAQILVPDKREIIERSRFLLQSIIPSLQHKIQNVRTEYKEYTGLMLGEFERRLESLSREVTQLRRMIAQLDPQTVLERGYSIVRGVIRRGGRLEIEQAKQIVIAEVTDVKQK